MARPNSRWMPLDWGDYWRDTAHLTGAEHGGYLNLLGTYWTTGKALPDDDDRLCRMARMSSKEWRSARPVIAEFFTIRDGFWFQKRMENELDRAHGIYAKKLAKMNEINEKRSRQSSTITSPNGARPSCPPLPSPSPSKSNKKKDSRPKGSDEAFERWWSNYPLHVGKGKARIAFKSALTKTKGDVDLLTRAAQAYAERRAGEDPRYTAHPTTWLNGERWADATIHVEQPKATREQELEIFYAQFLKTGRWLPAFGDIEDLTDEIKIRVQTNHERASVEAAGQQSLGLAVLPVDKSPGRRHHPAAVRSQRSHAALCSTAGDHEQTPITSDAARADDEITF